MNPITRIAVHTVATLPDSLNARKEVLHCLRACLPPGHGMQTGLSEMIALLEGHEKHQLLLNIQFSESQTP